MKKLKLPVIKPPRYEPKPLSMDEYHEFVMSNLKHIVNKKGYWKLKELRAVDVPFVIK